MRTVPTVLCSPTVRDGTVYTADSNGVVYALDAATGSEEWTHDTGRNLHSRALVVDDGTVFVGTAGTMPAVASGDTDGSKAGQVLALDAATGAVGWTFEGPEDWFTGPACGDGRVYVGNHTGDVVALDTGSGEAVWTWRPSPRDDVAGDEERVAHAAVLAPPTYADGTAYVPVHALGRVAALDAASGEAEWWRTLAAQNVKSSPAVDSRTGHAREALRALARGRLGRLADGDGVRLPVVAGGRGRRGLRRRRRRAAGGRAVGRARALAGAVRRLRLLLPGGRRRPGVRRVRRRVALQAEQAECLGA